MLRSVTEAQANATAERILAEVVQPVHVGDHTLAARASIGVAPADAR